MIDDATKIIELKPCPFCGSAAKLEDYRLCWRVSCVNCDAGVIGDRSPELESIEQENATDWNALKRSAIAAWNRRASNDPPVANPVARNTEKDG